MKKPNLLQSLHDAVVFVKGEIDEQPIQIVPLELLELREENARLKEFIGKASLRKYLREEIPRLNFKLHGENVTLKRRVARLEKKLKNPAIG